MKDIVIPLNDQSHWNNEELRFALRSVHYNLANVGKIFLIGEKPDFVTDVIHIPCNDITLWKECNIFFKIMTACKDERISDTFLLMNDDHFLTSSFDINYFPYFYQGTIDKIIYQREVFDEYKEALINTYFELIDKSLPVKYFDVHTPILYNKLKFMTSTAVNWKRSPGFVIKSLYANSQNIEGAPYEDAKIDLVPADFDAYIEGKQIFSTGGGHAMGKKMIEHLQRLYPVKSPWET